MPQNIQDAVVAAEDRTFWTDKGIDPKGIIRAAFSNARGDATQGASTITQQYVKILYLTQERSLQRKVQEAILSLKIQKQQSKRRSSQGYLNTIYFGRGAYGVQAAAKAYFGVDAKQLNLRQSAVLASVLNNPSQFDPANGKSNKRAAPRPLPLRASRHGRQGTIPAGPGRRRPRSGCRSSPRSRRRASTAARRATCSRWSATSCTSSASPTSRSTAAACGSPRPSPRRRCRRPQQGVMGSGPDGFSDKQLHIAVASVEPGTGALRRLLRRPGLPAVADQLGRDRRLAGSTFKPFALATAHRRRLLAQEHLRRQLAVLLHAGTGARVRNEGTGPTGWAPTTARRSTWSRRPRSRSTRRTST